MARPMTSRIARARALLANPHHLRHYGGFVLAAVLAFITDAGILETLTRFAGLSPFLARPLGIACAIVVSWLVNRSITFAMTSPPTVREFTRFAAVSWTAQAVNYTVFSLILLAAPQVYPFTALVLACFVSMFVSYAGYRFGVFRRE